MIVALGGSIAQIAVALKMELLQVVARVWAGWHFAQKTFLGCAVTPSLDGAQIGKKISSATQRLERAAEVILRARVISRFDVAPILLDQGPEIAENALPVGHRPPAQGLGQRHRAADPRG